MADDIALSRAPGDAPHKLHRRQPVHGVTVGIMVLDTGFQ
jgi:hypothetical protein